MVVGKERSTLFSWKSHAQLQMNGQIRYLHGDRISFYIHVQTYTRSVIIPRRPVGVLIYICVLFLIFRPSTNFWMILYQCFLEVMLSWILRFLWIWSIWCFQTISAPRDCALQLALDVPAVFVSYRCLNGMSSVYSSWTFAKERKRIWHFQNRIKTKILGRCPSSIMKQPGMYIIEYWIQSSWRKGKNSKAWGRNSKRRSRKGGKKKRRKRRKEEKGREKGKKRRGKGNKSGCGTLSPNYNTSTYLIYTYNSLTTQIAMYFCFHWI